MSQSELPRAVRNREGGAGAHSPTRLQDACSSYRYTETLSVVSGREEDQDSASLMDL